MGLTGPLWHQRLGGGSGAVCDCEFPGITARPPASEIAGGW